MTNAEKQMLEDVIETAIKAEKKIIKQRRQLAFLYGLSACLAIQMIIMCFVR